MEKTLSVAKALYNEYYIKMEQKMDELKMHKLMYFLQRESLIVNKAILFDEAFLGWKYGPVLQSIRNEYRKDIPFFNVDEDVSPNTKALIKEIIDRYGALSSWKLSSLSHNEFSWKYARQGLAANENGHIKLKVDAIKVDAIRAKTGLSL